MPNGFTHPENLDVLTLAFTSQGYPAFTSTQFYEGFRAYHLTGHRGYEPHVDWSSFAEPDFRKPESHEAIEALLHAYTARFTALLTSNPNDPLTPAARHARLAWISFRANKAICVGYSLYQRKRGAWQEHLPKGWPIPGLDQYSAEEQQILRTMLGPNTIVFGTEGLPYSNAQAQGAAHECILDITEADEILCASNSLSGTAAWEQMNAVSDLFSPEASGLLLSAMRERALEASEDLLVMRWKREPRRINRPQQHGA